MFCQFMQTIGKAWLIWYCTGHSSECSLSELTYLSDKCTDSVYHGLLLAKLIIEYKDGRENTNSGTFIVIRMVSANQSL